MSRYLDQINSPEDLKKFSAGELTELAAEIREILVDTVSQTGGHLAPNLGVVELTLALHQVFNSPVDKIVWDVGHQSYVHKLITGRRERFHTLRQEGGISGFPKQSESAHDIFNTGHSSTSISAALGVALARDLAGQKYSVVAVIGDGAMTGGMAFEALNHAGHLGTNLIVVLNDNEMSIAGNVGALAGYLNRIRTDPKYYKGKEDLEQVLRRIPSIGPTVLKALERLKDGVKYLLVPGMLFEELGFTYLGPVDGHNITELKEVLQRAKTHQGPVLIHVLTKKGKGYRPAEVNPDRFHGIGPFARDTGQTLGGSDVPTYTQVFGKTMVNEAVENPGIVAITAAMPEGTGLVDFAAQFKKRFFDVGIAEEHAVTLAAGMAREGLKPVVAVYSTFLQRAYDQILHDVCQQNLPVVFALDRGGIVGEDGPTHHGLFDLSYLRPMPNMTIMAPKDENELRRMIRTAFVHDGPAAIRYPRGQGVGVPIDWNPEPISIGEGEMVKPGSDLYILAAGTMTGAAEQAAAELEACGVSAGVVNPRFIKPLDEELILRCALQTRFLVTVEENVLAGGFGSAVMELLERERVHDVVVTRIGIPDTFIEHGHPAALREKYGLTPEGIVRAVGRRLSLDSIAGDEIRYGKATS